MYLLLLLLPSLNKVFTYLLKLLYIYVKFHENISINLLFSKRWDTILFQNLLLSFVKKKLLLEMCHCRGR